MCGDGYHNLFNSLLKIAYCFNAEIGSCLLASMKLLNNSKNLSSNPLLRL
jgi:hypothetical protein